ACHLERHRKVRVERRHLEAVGRTGWRIRLRAEPADTLPVGERAVELRRAEVMPVGQPRLDERVVAVLLRYFGILDKTRAEPLDKLELNARHVVLAAVDNPLKLEARRLRVAARHESLAGLCNTLVIRIRVTVQRAGPVTPGHRIRGIPAVRAEV